ncbi:MAG TPA: acyl-CoA dehydrogenase family protein, partial [Aeromicrobium sp.]|nr:acyl-CoA dehydrogenase family protein [Aeromicrobium sp.]
MSHYKSNLRDIEFNLFELFGRDEVLGQDPFEELDLETAKSIVVEIDRLAREEIAESFADSDRNPPVYDPAAKTVVMPESFKKSYQAWMDSEWWRLQLPEELGGTRAPSSLVWATAELILGANPPVWMYAAWASFAHVVWKNGTDRDKLIAKHMVDRQWGSTMVLTEPDAGSDVG